MNAGQEAALRLIDFYHDHAWTQEAYARDAKGAPVSIGDTEAVSWCLLGAMEKLSIDSNHHDNFSTMIADSLYNGLRKTHPDSFTGGIASLNDQFFASRDAMVEGLRRVAKGGE